MMVLVSRPQPPPLPPEFDNQLYGAYALCDGCGGGSDGDEATAHQDRRPFRR